MFCSGFKLCADYDLADIPSNILFDIFIYFDVPFTNTSASPTPPHSKSFYSHCFLSIPNKTFIYEALYFHYKEEGEIFQQFCLA